MIAGLWRWIGTHPALIGRTLAEHVELSLAALAAVMVLGVPVGIAVARDPRVSGPVLAVVNTARTVPSLALLVLMLPVLGTGFLPSAVALTVYGLPAVMINTIVAMRGVDPDVVEAARGQGFADRQILARVTLPLALPVILAGVRTSAVQIVSGATLAVFIGGGGLGELISAGMGLLDIPQLVAGSLLVAFLAIVTEVGLGTIERGLARRFGAAA